jgi:small subunit ribosomal protein S6
MRHYEVTFIVDPVLSADEIKSTASIYQDMITDEGAKIVHNDELGLKQLAYTINKRSSGIYYCVEYSTDSAELNSKLELALRRDERIMRFLVIHLDKYAIQYNADKRAGKIGKAKRTLEKAKAAEAKAKAAKTKYVAPDAKSKAKPKAAAPKPKVESVAKESVVASTTTTTAEEE